MKLRLMYSKYKKVFIWICIFANLLRSECSIPVPERHWVVYALQLKIGVTTKS